MSDCREGGGLRAGSTGGPAKSRRAVRPVLGAVLAVATASAGVVGLSAASLASAAPATSSVPTTVSLSAPSSSRVTQGSEPETFTGTVTGHSGDGYPRTGAVKVVDTAGTTLCTGSLTVGSDDAADFTCVTSTLGLGVGAYALHAHFTGGSSSTSGYSYEPATSGTHSVTVATSAAKTPTVSLNRISSPVAYGSEAQSFTGTVAGVAGDGFPSVGAVTVKTSSNVVLCAASLSAGSGDSAGFSCHASTARKLGAGQYTLHAHYTGGTSSNPDYSYAGATSPSQTLTVTAGASTTTKLSLNHAIRVQGAEESETLTVTVAGKAGNGYPKGTVTIETTTGVTVCSTGERRGGADDSSKFTCSLRASTLVARAYELTATYTPTATRPSSTANVTYARSTSSRVKFTVTTAVATKSTLGQRSAAERYGSETQEHFTVEVTGKSGDGYPRGTVEVRTTGGTALCTSTAPTSHGSDTATFACSPGAESLGAGTYTIVGAYEPDSTHSSSSTSIAYAQSTSSSATFKVTAPGATRLYGATQDATAAAELESVYPGARGDCPGTASVRPVVLATDQHYPDALAASYLERWLGTGMLLTPATSASDATLSALRVEGITEVYVVGGPLAIATSVVSELEDTYAYECGGTTRTAAHLGVFRVYGQTQYTTAEEVAETPGPGYPRSLDLRGAYGRYDDTTGGGTAAPPTGARRTAILASGAEFQDAEAAATLAYADHLPLLLTTPTTLSPQALGAINDLGVTQVILMGGPLAVSDAVVSELASHQVSVLRVAGKDYTDTAEQLAEMELGTTKGYEGLGWAPTRGVTVARGDFYPDGLAGAVVAAHGGSTGGGAEPMLLTENPTEVGADLTVFLEEAGSKGIDGDGARVTSLTVLGGPLALTTSVVDSMVAELSS